MISDLLESSSASHYEGGQEGDDDFREQPGSREAEVRR